MMIVNERIITFLNSFETENNPCLVTIEEEALGRSIPIIKKETQSLLKVMLSIQKPMRILEIGTAVGFSVLLMSEWVDTTCQIVTIEKDDRQIPVAQSNIRKVGKEEQITLLHGDAKEELPKLVNPFDFIFMDAAKGQYLSFFPEILRLLSPRGVLVSDNVLQEGNIVESRYAITKRDRTIHDRMREYLYLLKHHEELVTTILTVGDGVAVSSRRAGRSGY